MLDREQAETYAGWFRALADATRAQILSLLAEQDGPLSVGQIVQRVPVGQSTVSAHLKVLVELHFVLAEQSRYRLDERCATRFPAALDAVLGPQRPATENQARVLPMTEEHASGVLAVYQQGLDSGNASFETAAPTWPRWDANHLAAHRFVAVDDRDEIIGWIAASPVSSRRVYAGVLEHSVYIRPDQQGRGVGRALLAVYIESTEAAGVWTLQSGIFPENQASLALHRRAGFRDVGRRERLGHHQGQWRDVILIERRTTRTIHPPTT